MTKSDIYNMNFKTFIESRLRVFSEKDREIYTKIYNAYLNKIIQFASGNESDKNKLLNSKEFIGTFEIADKEINCFLGYTPLQTSFYNINNGELMIYYSSLLIMNNKINTQEQFVSELKKNLWHELSHVLSIRTAKHNLHKNKIIPQKQEDAEEIDAVATEIAEFIKDSIIADASKQIAYEQWITSGNIIKFLPKELSSFELKLNAIHDKEKSWQLLQKKLYSYIIDKSHATT